MYMWLLLLVAAAGKKGWGPITSLPVNDSHCGFCLRYYGGWNVKAISLSFRA